MVEVVRVMVARQTEQGRGGAGEREGEAAVVLVSSI
jgi:hypothetical protein